MLLVELAQRSDRAPVSDHADTAFCWVACISSLAQLLRASRSWRRAAAGCLRRAVAASPGPSCSPEAVERLARRCWMRVGFGLQLGVDLRGRAPSGGRRPTGRPSSWPKIWLLGEDAEAGDRRAVGERRPARRRQPAAGGRAAGLGEGRGGERQDCAGGDAGDEQGCEHSWGSSLEPCIGGEAEDLGDVVGLFGDRLGDVEPERPERRLPEDADADRGAKAEVVANRGERQVGRADRPCRPGRAGRACRCRRSARS